MNSDSPNTADEHEATLRPEQRPTYRMGKAIATALKDHRKAQTHG